MKQEAFIDGVAREIEPGETILSFVNRYNGDDAVPTLCNAAQLEPYGACRVCVVETAATQEGPRKVVASCHTPVQADSHVFTASKKIHRLRHNVMELLLTDHPLDCLTCESNNNCELQSVAAQVGIREVRYPEGKNHQDVPKDLSHPYMRTDMSKCILCYRCVRACDEIQGEFVLGVHGRGFDSKIIMGLDTNFADSPCVSCGACAQTCPTAAISDVYQSKSIQTAEPPTRTVCTYCGVGCNLDVSTRGDEVISIQAPIDAEVNQGHTCLKGRYAFKFYNHRDRLRTPLIRRNGSFSEATWDEAYDYIAENLNTIRSEHGPDAFAGISSARCTNEENFLMQKFVRAVIGTNNVDCCARVCHSPTAYGMQQSFGTGAATNSISDIPFADLFLVIGANPTQGHPVTGAKIKQAVMKGTKLIVIDPREIELVKYADYHLQLRPGSNVALLNMFAHYIVAAELVDEAFVAERCEGFEAFRSRVQELDLDAAEAATGLDRNLVREAAIAYATAPNAMEFHGLGVTEHSQGSKTVMLLSNLAMMTGNIGRPGVGINPLRGQNNVQGAADMGVQPHQGAGYLDVTNPEIQEYYNKAYGVEMPSEVGYKIPQMFNAALDGKLKALWIMGEDVVQTDPNTKHVSDSLSNLDLLVVQELFMTPTAELAHVVLPGSSFLEKSGTFTNGERRIQRVNRVVNPLPGTKPDGQIVVDIMNRMGFEQEGYDPAITLEEIARIVPFFKGVVWDELGDQGKQWPVLEGGQDTQLLHTESFKRGKGKFHFFDYVKSAELVDNEDAFPYVLTTGRLLEHYNCGSMTRRTPNGEIVTEDVLVVHPEDAQFKDVDTGDLARLFSARGEVELRVSVSEEVNPGILYTTFHFPEAMVNCITGNVTDEESLCPEYKVVSVDFEKVAGGIVQEEEAAFAVPK
jgi:formate dehydrogenase major subunit